MKPVKISIKDKEFLRVVWDDGKVQNIKLMELRRECPCALCKAALEEEGSTYIPIYTLDQLSITEIKTVGFYGLNIVWRDGHNTGIYQYNDLLKMNGFEE